MHLHFRRIVTILLPIGLLGGASITAQAVIEAAGVSTTFGELSSFPAYWLYYCLLCGSFLAAFHGVARKQLSTSAFLVSAGLGFLPEALYPLVARFLRDPGSFYYADLAIRALELPGWTLYLALTGFHFDRWAVGVSSPPATFVMVTVTTIACLNMVGWLGCLKLVAHLYRRTRVS